MTQKYLQNCQIGDVDMAVGDLDSDLLISIYTVFSVMALADSTPVHVYGFQTGNHVRGNPFKEVQ